MIYSLKKQHLTIGFLFRCCLPDTDLRQMPWHRL